MKINILVADDHPLVRDGLRLVLNTHSDLEIIAEVEDGRTAVREARAYCPDVVIIDITMPELNGIEATRQIREGCPHSRIIVLSIHASTKHVLWALEAGASGYVLKGTASSEVVDAVRTVYSGGRYLSPKISDQVGEDELRHLENRETDNPVALLSAREREVLQLVVEGKSSPEIAETLHLSPKTVETYRYRLMQKLNINDVPTLVKFAIQNGLTPLD